MTYTEQTYEEIVILVPVSCSILFRFLPSFPMSLPTRLLWAKIFRGTSSTLIQRQSTQYYFSSLFNNKSENNMRLFAYLHSFKLFVLKRINPKANAACKTLMCPTVWRDTDILVSLASFSIISWIILQACEQPSLDEWIVMAFSVAPAFSLRWISTLRQSKGWLSRE